MSTLDSAKDGTPLAATSRSMISRALETAVAITLTIGVAVCASVLAGRPAEGPGGPRQDHVLPGSSDRSRFDRILPGGRQEPLFVDFESGHFLTPPFALEPVDRDHPLAVSNLAFPEKLKDWIRCHGIDAVVQADGGTITLIGLEMQSGQPVPIPDTWPRLKPADARRLFERSSDQPRRPKSGEWAHLVRQFRPEDPPAVLPFLTREGGLVLLNLRPDRADPKDAEGIRLTYQIRRGPGPRGADPASGQAARRPPAGALLDDPAGPVQLQTWKGGIVVTRPGSPEWIEIDQGKVVIKVNRAGRAGPADAPETLIEASRLVTDVMDLDGRRLRVTVMGSSKAIMCRRVRDRLAVEVGEKSVISCDRITLDLPYFEHLSKDPRADAIVNPKAGPLRSKR